MTNESVGTAASASAFAGEHRRTSAQANEANRVRTGMVFIGCFLWYTSPGRSCLSRSRFLAGILFTVELVGVETTTSLIERAAINALFTPYRKKMPGTLRNC